MPACMAMEKYCPKELEGWFSEKSDEWVEKWAIDTRLKYGGGDLLTNILKEGDCPKKTRIRVFSLLKEYDDRMGWKNRLKKKKKKKKKNVLEIQLQDANESGEQFEQLNEQLKTLLHEKKVKINRFDGERDECRKKLMEQVERMEALRRYIYFGGTLVCGLGLCYLLNNKQAMEKALEELTRKLAESKDQLYRMGKGVVDIVGGKISDTIDYCSSNGTEVMEALRKNN